MKTEGDIREIGKVSGSQSIGIRNIWYDRQWETYADEMVWLHDQARATMSLLHFPRNEIYV